ncbi:unnamed protein product [Mytilus coruscus]|uniref:RNase H type-1 domain-containing protein n=1 Tax=Mytilus coruscus TaxID=42192 RepID=A0A6J8A2M7_MYTCO|nr:unnamed protein product [Mytilus coruscus]
MQPISTSFRSTAHEIISLIKSIQKHHGIKINFEWTPGHADVRGNEIADKLAKEAAKEANEIEKEAHITVTKQDIKTAARILVNKKCYSFLNEPNDKLDDTNASICSAHLEVTEVINYIETNTEEYTSPSDQMDAIANFDFLEQLQGQCEIQTTQSTYDK